MISVQPMRRDSKSEEFSRANSRKLFQAFPTGPKYTATSSSSSESSKTSESIKTLESIKTSGSLKTSESLKASRLSKPQITTVAQPNMPLTTGPTSPITSNNEAIVFDVNDTAALHSLIARNGAWFLDVNDLDAMDKESSFQYVAMRPSPQSDLVLTRVPELRNLIYVKFDEEGRPYPIQMRKVPKARYLLKIQENVTEEENKEHLVNNSSFWEALSVTLQRSIINNETLQNEESHEELLQNDM